MENTPGLKTDNSMRKPQLDFDDAPIDNSYEPYVPVLEKKYHELAPLSNEIKERLLKQKEKHELQVKGHFEIKYDDYKN